MPDGTSIVDNPKPARIDNQINIPPGRFESPNSHEQLAGYLDAFLELPRRISTDTTPRNLGRFLMNRGFITSIHLWERSWGFRYQEDERAIYTSERAMPRNVYDHYTVRLGYHPQSREALWPRYEEMDQYRFLHEVGHGYQSYVQTQEGQNRWFDRALTGDADSHLATLFSFCYETREAQGRGVTTWGNQTGYNDIVDRRSQTATRAIEDANELITMYLWHPEYFTTYIKYLSLQLPRYTQANLDADGLTRITPQQATALGEVVKSYVDEMKERVS